MPVFDFDGGNAFFNSGGISASASGTLTDTTPSPVSFTASVSGSDLSGNVFLTVADIAFPGFRISASTTAGGPPSNLNLVFDLASTTAARTAFDTNVVPVLNVNGTNLNGVFLAGGEVSFSLSVLNDNIINVASLTVDFTCFCAGTRITTPDGACPVETLTPGDMVRLADGRDVPVRWVGRQQVDSAVAHPMKSNPIRITRGALGGGLPERDLRVSPDHAICIDGYLINAGALVNGTTIYQERDVTEDFTYYHVETDAHELILAEGVAAETFIDYTTRAAFENAHEAPDHTVPEMPLPRISSARLVPEHIKRALRPLIAAE